MSIITRVKNGDEEAFSELIEEYKLSIYKTAKAILKDEDDVCDAIQDTALSIYQKEQLSQEYSEQEKSYMVF